MRRKVASAPSVILWFRQDLRLSDNPATRAGGAKKLLGGRQSLMEGLEFQPAFERDLDVANDASIKFSGSFAHEFGELHALDALDVDVALLPQPRHAGQSDLVGCVLTAPKPFALSRAYIFPADIC